MSEKEEHQLSRGLNSLHDEGAVHASDLEKIMKFFAVQKRDDLKGLSGVNFIKAASIVMVYFSIYFVFGTNL